MSTPTITASVTIAGETVPRVELTPVAVDLLRSLWEEHGPLMFHQSGGCCDGSSPMLFMAGEFITSDQDVRLGQFDLAPADEPSQPLDFWMSAEQFNYWSHTFLTVDVVPGRGSGFSAESPRGVRFLIRSELMTVITPFAAAAHTDRVGTAAAHTDRVGTAAADTDRVGTAAADTDRVGAAPAAPPAAAAAPS